MSESQRNRRYRERHPDRVRAMKRDWESRNRPRSRAISARGNALVRAAIREFVHACKSAPCMDCGGTFDPICMDFDHRPDEAKLANVSQLRALDAVKAEIAKCDVVCSNCHRLRTKARRQWGRRKAEVVTSTVQLSLITDGESGHGS